MTKSLSHFGVLGMHWGQRKNRLVVRGNRALTKQEDQDEISARRATTMHSKSPHTERKEADIILDRAQRESGANLDKALNRFARENDLKSAIKRGYVTPPKKNVEEMSSKEIDSVLNSHPSIKQHLQKDFDNSVKRGKVIAGTVLATYALIKVSQVVVDTMVRKQAINAMADTIGKFY